MGMDERTRYVLYVFYVSILFDLFGVFIYIFITHLHRPRVILMDELGQGLDATNRYKLLRLLDGVAMGKGKLVTAFDGDGGDGSGSNTRVGGTTLITVSHHDDELDSLTCW